MVEIIKGRVVEKWRNDRRVRRVVLQLDADAINDVVRNEILRQAREQGITVPDLESADPDLEYGILDKSDRNGGYEYPYLCHVHLSYYEDFKGCVHKYSCGCNVVEEKPEDGIKSEIHDHKCKKHGGHY